MSVKTEELSRRLNKLKEMEDALIKKHMQAGYVCGLINGIRLSRSVISGEEAILERDEVQEPGDNNSRMILQKVDVEGATRGFTIMTFDSAGGLLKLEQI
jgi:hypothetical protein